VGSGLIVTYATKMTKPIGQKQSKLGSLSNQLRKFRLIACNYIAHQEVIGGDLFIIAECEIC